MTEVRVSAQNPGDFFQRMAVLYADPLREKILIELYLREMSASGFYAEFGGGSVPRVDRHFKKLAEHGWLTFVRSESGGRRRGGTEHFYTATELAILDNATWAQLPRSIKVAVSRRSFEQLAQKVRNAMQAETFDARPDRHLSWTPLLLDQLGWEQMIARVDATFESLSEEQANASLRILDSGGSLTPTTVVLAAFESPSRYPKASVTSPPLNLAGPADTKSPMPLSLRLAKVFTDPICLKIITETSLRDMSAAQFHERFGGGAVSGIRRRFKTLSEIGWLQKIGEKTGGARRGATEHFYRATGPAIFGNDTWVDVPPSIRAAYSWRTFEQLTEQVMEAIGAGTFDTRPDSHLSWWTLRLDPLGWKNVVSAVDALFAFGFEAQEEAKLRMAASDEQPITATLALAAFESPKDSAKAP